MEATRVDASTVCGTAGLSKNWAWRFLKRNRRYRDDCAYVFSVVDKLAAQYGPVNSWDAGKLLDAPDAWHYRPPKQPSESDNAWRIRSICEGVEPHKALLHKGYGWKWGLSEVVDPLEDDLPSCVNFLPESAPTIWHRAEDIEGDPLSEGERVPPVFYARLDGSKSITKQLAALRKVLIPRQRYLKRYGLRWRTTLHPDKWPLYLRVFDAVTAGATAREIAQAEFSHIPDEFPDYAGQARVRATYEQASILVEGGYRQIALADD